MRGRAAILFLPSFAVLIEGMLFSIFFGYSMLAVILGMMASLACIQVGFVLGAIVGLARPGAAFRGDALGSNRHVVSAVNTPAKE